MPGTLTKTFRRLQKALAWRLHRLLGDRLVYGTLLASARLCRRLLKKPVFIGVTGSAGKTMTKELLDGATLTKAILYGANLSGAYLSGAIWTDGATICAPNSIGQCN